MRPFMVSLLVRDYDEAIAYYCEKVGFKLLEDTPLGEGKRWIRVGEADGFCILLALARSEPQLSLIGKQMGGRVGFFLNTDNFDADYERMKACGVHFVEEPRYQEYGTVIVFEDLYGNRWDMIGKPSTNPQ
jgi:catechol 2,3-dioxygenase-like lactoylglutathione lyase family enzyme